MAIGQGLGGLLELVTAGFFCLLGWHLATRFPTSPQGAAAMRGFGAYWLFQGIASLLRSGVTLAAAAGIDVNRGEAAIIVLAAHALVLLGIAGFLFYLALIFVGRRSAAWATLGVYIVFGASQWWFIATHPLEAVPTDFGVPFYASAGGSVFPPQIAWLLALVPFVAGTIGLIFLGIRTQRPMTRFRATLVGGALLFWALASAAGYAVRIGGLVQLAPELVALLAAIVVYLAYFPPGRVTRWLEKREGLRG